MIRPLIVLLLACLPVIAGGGGHDRPPLPSPAEIAKLPPDGGEKWNRLIFEKSPYLLQHAANPVDWYPWGKEAFERAKRENKPIFLSIGYATCHWCHVMERESFEDEEVAALMNKHFINVKVDREERPDVDKVYMQAAQAITGSGGWPLTAFLTPERKPYMAGTYFPKKTIGNRIGMMDLLPRMADLWTNRGNEVLAQAENLVQYLQRNTAVDPTAIGEKTLKAGFEGLKQQFDAVNGGFGGNNKFPTAHQLTFLLRYHHRTGEAKALEMVEKTLQHMRRGGIWDHLGDGFHRYSTDAAWVLPHFEKMLYDQAINALAYLEAYRVTGKQTYADTARSTFAYVDRRLAAPRGAFYAAEDAETEGVEGKYYVWTTAEVKQILGEEDAALFAAVYNLREGGNFAEEATGRFTGANVLHLTKDIEDLAAERSMKPKDLEKRLLAGRKKLLDARSKRIRPIRDEKILTDWNGLMIAALARGARTLDAPEYALRARKAADFVLKHLRTKDGRLLKRYARGEAGLTAHLDDYAFMVWGLLELYEATFEIRYLDEAIALNSYMLGSFWDEGPGGLFMTAADSEELIMRTKEVYDGARPSGNSVAALNNLRIGRITAETSYEEKAAEIMKAFSGAVTRGPSAYTQFLQALDFSVGPSFEIVIAGNTNDAGTRAMLKQVYGRYIPNKVVLLKTRRNAKDLARVAPYTQDQGTINKKATVYLCQNYACKKPTADPKEVATMLEEATARK
ncbi:MAG: thioredoxin domain-containing protein [Acidobacteriota bacterium]|nr:thioredoxin domain-containing protein [Acidobacteriota bacterium]